MEELKEIINKEIEVLDNVLLTGSVKSYEEYRYYIGRRDSYQHVIKEIIELKRG